MALECGDGLQRLADPETLRKEIAHAPTFRGPCDPSRKRSWRRTGVYLWRATVAFYGEYVGLADGYLKLRTGSSNVTLVRDLLLYSIAVGALVDQAIAVRRQRRASRRTWASSPAAQARPSSAAPRCCALLRPRPNGSLPGHSHSAPSLLHRRG